MCIPGAGIAITTQKIRPKQPAEKVLTACIGQRDIYLSVNEFLGRRKKDRLKSLGAFFVDIDSYVTIDEAYETLDSNRIPEPNLIMHSGRGMHFYWLIEPAPPGTRRYWETIERHLVKTLEPIGADQGAHEVNRLLRLAGTINSKNGKVVKGTLLRPWRWHIEDFGNEVLPRTRAEVRASKASVKKKISPTRKRSGAKRNQQHNGISEWWRLVYRDLIEIAQQSCGGRIPEGSRNNFLFLVSVALSHFTHVNALPNEILKHSRLLTPDLNEDEVLRQMQTVIERARLEAQAHQLEKPVPKDKGRYHMKRENIRERLGKLITPDLEPKLSGLASNETLAERRRRKDQARYSRRHAEVVQASRDKAAAAKKLREEGLSWKEVGDSLGIGPDAARKRASRAATQP